MRILMLSWEFPPHVVGGLGAHVNALVPALAHCGVDVTLVTPRWNGGEPVTRLDEHAVIYRVDTPVAQPGNFYADAQETNLNLEEVANRLWTEGVDLAGQRGGPHSDEPASFDLIHVHDWLVAFAATSLKRLHKTPLIATMHATERGRNRGHLSGGISQAINGTEWWLSYEAWRVITVSQFMGHEIESYFQLPSDKVDIVPNGIETSAFDALEGLDLSEFRTRWAQPEERLVFFVGRMQYEKGAQILVEAAPHVLREFPQTRFVLAGTGGMMESLRRRVSELGIADKALIAGFVQDADRDRLFKVADAAVFPSLYEPFGIVALEAMAAKCPVVVSDIGGLREVVKHERTGLIVQPEDPESLAWGILQTLRQPDKARARAIQAYHLVCDEYNWDRIAERTIEVYDRVLGERAQVDWK